MAIIQPFAALRPRADLAGRVCELPYDVLSSAEARVVAAGNPLSFLRVSKPEIDLPAGADLYSPEVYAKGRENFGRLVAEGVLTQDSQPGFYLYRQVMGAHTQTGIVAVASCLEYQQGIIRRHELTRLDKEDDRVRHIEALDAQTGPAFFTYPANAAIDGFVAERTGPAPDVDFVAADQVRHCAWCVFDAAGIRFLEEQFARVPRLYIADGHHRSAAANRVCLARQGRGGSDRFLAVIFPHNQMQILPYNRVLKDGNGLTPTELLRRLEQVCRVEPADGAPPRHPHEVSLYLGGRWLRASFQPQRLEPAVGIDGLDVSLLQRHVLEPIFGIQDPRTSERIQFVGGVRGMEELERMVDGGAGFCAFALFPTRIEELMAIADAGDIMPPKSTWFEPKLRDGMFCYRLTGEDRG